MKYPPVLSDVDVSELLEEPTATQSIKICEDTEEDDDPEPAASVD